MGPIAEHRAVCFIEFPTKTRIYPRVFSRADKLREQRISHATVVAVCFTIARLKRTYSAKITHSGVPEWQPLASSHIKLDNYTTIRTIMQHFFINISVEKSRNFKRHFCALCTICRCFFISFADFSKKYLYPPQ